MNHNRLIAFCSKLETKLDTVLFRKPEDESETGVKKTVAGGVATGAVAGGGLLAHRAVMRGYGGEGGVTEAYKNLGRNVARAAQENAATVANRVGSGVQAARVSVGRNAAQGKPLLTKLLRASRAFLGQTIKRA